MDPSTSKLHNIERLRITAFTTAELTDLLLSSVPRLQAPISMEAADDAARK
jgi:hypothetical protein